MKEIIIKVDSVGLPEKIFSQISCLLLLQERPVYRIFYKMGKPNDLPGAGTDTDSVFFLLQLFVETHLPKK